VHRVTIGIAEGRSAIDSDSEHWLPSHRVTVVDTTGAGDACAAGIAVALVDGSTFLNACKFGHAAAALAARKLGARPSLPSRADVEQRGSHGICLTLD
jgi:ribokinase